MVKILFLLLDIVFFANGLWGQLCGDSTEYLCCGGVQRTRLFGNDCCGTEVYSIIK